MPIHGLELLALGIPIPVSQSYSKNLFFPSTRELERFLSVVTLYLNQSSVYYMPRWPVFIHTGFCTFHMLRSRNIFPNMVPKLLPTLATCARLLRMAFMMGPFRLHVISRMLRDANKREMELPKTSFQT